MLEDKFITLVMTLPDACKDFSQDGTIIFSLPVKLHTCPQCHNETCRVHDYRKQKIKTSASIVCNRTFIYRRRRYRCQHCGKVFSEQQSFIGRYQQIPYSDVLDIITAHEEVEPATKIARRFCVSPTTVSRIFGRVNPSVNHLDKAISLDEFHGNAGAKFQVVLNSLTQHKCLNVFSNRSSEVLYYEISKAYPIAERLKVEHVSIDLSPFFKRVVEDCFPNAQIAADHFHVVRLANDALDSVRKEVQANLTSTQRKHFKRSRRLLLKREKDLNTEDYQALQVLLNFSDKLSAAYAMKEQYYKLFDSKDSVEFNEKLLLFRLAVEAQNIPVFNKLLRTTVKWKKEIIHGIATGLNNGFTEGCNTVIKTLKRVSFGYKKFSAFRRRIIFVLNSEARRLRRSTCHKIAVGA